MTVQTTIEIKLGISGPFLCSGTAPASWGFDATFDRDYEGRPYIDRSHIKGKLREAMEELCISSTSINDWFGKKGPRENGNLFFSDLRLADDVESPLKGSPAERMLTRIAKDNERRVVIHNAMLVMENAFPGGSDPSGVENSYIWTGTISFVAADKTAAEKIAQGIHTGLKWITACGAEKSIGFGRLKTVSTDCKTNQIDLRHSSATKPTSQLTLTITTEEPLMLGDIRIKANYQESMDYITGNTLKGALAQALNTACGIQRPALTHIDVKNTEVQKAFPLLTKYFSDIRFTHAFPSITNKRPVVIPYSVISVDGKPHDIVLQKEPVPFGDKMPAFHTDWKDDDYPVGFGLATPLRFAKTRTAIDDDSRRADDGNMFTYQYVCPIDDSEKKNAIIWIGGIYLDSVTLQGNDTLAALQGELECALGLLRYLGKRASRVVATVMPGEPVPYQADHFKPKDNMVIVALQSDALMVKAEDLVEKQTADKLMELYKAYWHDISGGECELSHFFAMQKLRGGFLRRNKQPADEPYYPYYLTEAGSVFVLKMKDKAKAQTLFNLWDKTGLTLPPWTESVYGKEVWEKCPYVPENGYGEVAINLDISAVLAGTEGGAK